MLLHADMLEAVASDVDTLSSSSSYGGEINDVNWSIAFPGWQKTIFIYYSTTSNNTILSTDIAGGVTPKQLILASGTLSNGAAGVEIYKRTTNPTAKHYLSFVHWCQSKVTWGAYNALRVAYPTYLVTFNGATNHDRIQYASFADAEALLFDASTGKISIAGQESGSGVLSTENYNFIELEIDPVNATIKVWIDKVLVLTATAIPWLSSGQLTAIGFRAQPDVTSAVSQRNAGVNMLLDDILLMDNSGPAPWNAWPTGITTFRRVPLLSIQDDEFTNFGGAASKMDALSDGLATGQSPSTSTYCTSDGISNISDTFLLDLSGLGNPATIYSILTTQYKRRNGLGTRHLDHRMKSGALVVDKSISDVSNINVNWRPDIQQVHFDTAPDGTPFSMTNLATTAFGYVAKD